MKRLGWLLLALFAGAILVGTGVWAMARPSRAIPTPTPLPVSSLPRAETPGAAASALPALPAESANGAVLALVNGEALGRADLDRALAIDRALAALVGTPVSDEATTLQRLVNELLVRQAARQAGFAVPEAQVTAALQEFLTARGIAPETLDAALAAEGIGREVFNAYFGDLLLVQQFSAAQAQAAGITVAEYVNRLRQAATVELAPVTAAPLTETPATPTALPPAASPTPATPELPRGIEPGQYAPDFSLPLLGDPAGQRLTWADLVGHPTVLSFWVSWCGHCRAQTPVLVEAYQKYAPLGVAFVGINVQEAAETAQAYVTEQQIPYPIALDGDGAVAGAYQLPGYPTTYFLDAEGRVVARHIGQLAAGDVENYIGQLLAVQAP